MAAGKFKWVYARILGYLAFDLLRTGIGLLTYTTSLIVHVPDSGVREIIDPVDYIEISKKQEVTCRAVVPIGALSTQLGFDTCPRPAAVTGELYDSVVVRVPFSHSGTVVCRDMHGEVAACACGGLLVDRGWEWEMMEGFKPRCQVVLAVHRQRVGLLLGHDGAMMGSW